MGYHSWVGQLGSVVGPEVGGGGGGMLGLEPKYAMLPCGGLRGYTLVLSRLLQRVYWVRC